MEEGRKKENKEGRQTILFKFAIIILSGYNVNDFKILSYRNRHSIGPYFLSDTSDTII